VKVHAVQALYMEWVWVLKKNIYERWAHLVMQTFKICVAFETDVVGLWSTTPFFLVCLDGDL
jgi:hypothetical protein